MRLKLKVNVKKKILDLLLIILILIFLIATYLTIRVIYYDNINKKEIKELINEVVNVEVDNDLVKEDEYVIDFAKLKEINPDVVAWLIIPNTNINYPVLQSSDDSYYLLKNIYQKYNRNGSIFMHYENKKDLSDNNTIIFGHAMKNGTMFNNLKKIYNGDLGRDVKIYLYQEDKIIEYSVYASYVTTFADLNPLDVTISHFSKTDRKFNYNVLEEKTLTLSTCYKDSTERLIVHAVKSDEKIIN